MCAILLKLGMQSSHNNFNESLIDFCRQKKSMWVDTFAHMTTSEVHEQIKAESAKPLEMRLRVRTTHDIFSLYSNAVQELITMWHMLLGMMAVPFLILACTNFMHDAACTAAIQG
jgi:hypothetical protein